MAEVFACIMLVIMVLVTGFSLVENSQAQVAGGLVISPKDKPLEPYYFMGAASCNGSNCHGSTKPRPTKPEGNFLFLKTNKVLLQPDSQPIGENLGIDKPETSQRCLVCHAVDVVEENQGINYDLTEGVTCEGGHGPAGKWLGPHTRRDWTKERGRDLGMFDTKIWKNGPSSVWPVIWVWGTILLTMNSLVRDTQDSILS